MHDDHIRLLSMCPVRRPRPKRLHAGHVCCPLVNGDRRTCDLDTPRHPRGMGLSQIVDRDKIKLGLRQTGHLHAALSLHAASFDAGRPLGPNLIFQNMVPVTIRHLYSHSAALPVWTAIVPDFIARLTGKACA